MTDEGREDTEGCLGEVIRRAERCGPQRVGGPEGRAVVLSETDFDLLLAEAGLREADLRHDDDPPGGEPVSFLEFMQRSPLAEAIRAGEIDLDRYPDWPRGL